MVVNNYTINVPINLNASKKWTDSFCEPVSATAILLYTMFSFSKWLGHFGVTLRIYLTLKSQITYIGTEDEGSSESDVRITSQV